jgi:transcriptional regulator with XRE-family HTH domain
MSNDLALEHDTMVDVLHDPVKLGASLRAARKRMGMSQEAAANLMDMARTTIVAIEQGIRHVRVEELQEMAKLYECDFSQFFNAPELPAEPVLSARKRVLKRVFLRDLDTTMHATLVGLNVPPKELERMAATLLHMLIEEERGE